MRALKTILAGIAVLLLLFVAIGLMLPSTKHVERSIVMQATPAELLPYIDGYRRFNEWSPWHGLDPNTRYVFSGPDAGVGARLEWHSAQPDVGSGSQEIIEVVPGRIATRLVFEGQDGEPARSAMLYTVTDAGLRVTWTFDIDFGHNLVFRWFGLMLEGPIGVEYSKGLDKLKERVEADAAGVAPDPEVAP